MAAPIGSSIFFTLALLSIAALVLLLLRYYLPLRTTPAYLLFPVFLSLALPASIILIVPIDLASSAGSETGEHTGIWLPARALLVSWRITYWLTFVLTWVVLPLLGEYCDSGYKEPRDRIIYSLRSNARYQLTVLGIGAVGAIYFFLNEGFHFLSLKALVMALAYAWGLILAVYLMGNGLVALPRRLFREANVGGRLRRLQAQAPRIHDKMIEAEEEVRSHEQQVTQLKLRKNGTSRDFQEWIDDLADLCATSSSSRVLPSAATLPSSQTAVPHVITDRYLADLTRQLKRSLHKKHRYSSEWTHLLQSCVRVQAIIDATTSKKLDFGKPPPFSPYYRRINLLNPQLRYYLHAFVLPALYYVLSGILALASVSLLWSEFTHQINSNLSIVKWTIVPSTEKPTITFGNQIIAGLWLSYMCTATLYSITTIKVWGNRALVRRSTYLESATWYSGQVAKLTVPLAYNFVTLTPSAIYKETVFYKFLGVLVDLTPLGKGFSNFFPILILLPVSAALFGLYGRVKGMLGFADLLDDYEDEAAGDDTIGWREGRSLIDREIRSGAAPGGSLGLVAGAGRSSLEHDTAPMLDEYRDSDPLHPSSNLSSATQAQSFANPSSSNLRTAGATSARPRPPIIPPDEDGGEGNFFEDFGRRVRNTLDRTEAPAFFRGISEGFKRPRWMGGEDEGGSGDAPAEGGAFGGLFGRAPEGRVRLG